MSAYSLERTQDGSFTLRSLELDQACHSNSGAWLEARERYAIPCRVRERSRCTARLRVLDIGTGPGWNVAGLLEAVADGDAEVDVVSLESDPEVFQLGDACVAEDVSGGGSWLGVARTALTASAERAGEPVAWSGLKLAGKARLLFGDARETLAELGSEEQFDAVFLDPFSPAKAPQLWEAEFLSEIARRMRAGALLSTYTTSLAVRAKLRATGLEVGPGPRVGEKHQGTLASQGVGLDAFDARTERKLRSRLARL